MQMTPFSPRAHTPGWIEGLAIVRTARDGITRTLVAESRLSVGLRIAGAAQLWRDGAWQPLPRYTLTGVHCSSRTVRTAPESALVLAHLHPAAAPLLGMDAENLVERTVDLTTLWPAAELEVLAQRVARLADDSERVACLEDHVTQRLLQNRRPDPAVVEAVNRIRAAPADVRIAELAQALGLSVDTLARRFAAGVGTSPKRFARAVRLRAAVLAYSAGVTLTEVAMEAGYYDQSHFVREMRLATGQAPNRLLTAQTYC
jgi:AraC-like DNA-binding protein